MLIVQKYGGSSLALPQQIKSVARRIADLHQQGHQIIVVVSAMGNSTDSLVDLAYSVSSRPNRRELDMLVSTGERVSMSLMSMALTELGCPAISFTGSQAGLFTNPSHSNAKIIDLKPIRVEEELDKGKVVVLAGFQGVDPISKEITTLGRGGSDTTAVAMAAHFEADSCQIMKEFEGVYSADPRLATNAKTLSELDYNSLLDITFWGGKMLHHRAAALAKKLNVPLFIGCAQQPNNGTKILNEVSMYEEGQVLSVNSIPEVRTYKIEGDGLSQALQEFSTTINKAKLPTPHLLASVFDQDHTRVMFTGPKEVLSAISSAIADNDKIESFGETLSAVTVTCQSHADVELPNKISAQLKERGIDSEKLITSSLSVTVFVKPQHREQAVQALHR